MSTFFEIKLMLIKQFQCLLLERIMKHHICGDFDRTTAASSSTKNSRSSLSQKK